MFLSSASCSSSPSRISPSVLHVERGRERDGACRVSRSVRLSNDGPFRLRRKACQERLRKQRALGGSMRARALPIICSLSFSLSSIICRVSSALRFLTQNTTYSADGNRYDNYDDGLLISTVFASALSLPLPLPHIPRVDARAA